MQRLGDRQTTDRMYIVTRLIVLLFYANIDLNC